MSFLYLQHPLFLKSLSKLLTRINVGEKKSSGSSNKLTGWKANDSQKLQGCSFPVRCSKLGQKYTMWLQIFKKHTNVALATKGFFFLPAVETNLCKRLTAVWAKSWTTKLSSWNNDDIAPLRRWMGSVYASYLKLWHIKLPVLMLAAQRKCKQWFLARIWCWMDTNWFGSMLSE